MSERGAALAYLVGARPNFIKMAPLLAELKRRAPERDHVLINTGQHYSREMAAIFVDELGIGPPDYELAVGSGLHGAQTGRALERIETVLVDLRPAAFVVAGDVNSTLAGALAAAKLSIPVAHLEAGLRSFDRTMPEEINRVLTDQVSRWCLTHSPEAEENLAREGVGRERVFFVGNTMIDTLVRMRPRIDRSPVRERLELADRGYLLVTLHRPALVDGPLLADAMAALEDVAGAMPVVFPVHPRTRKMLDGAECPGVILTDPVGYLDFLSLESGAAAVLTDSGGIQEETTYLGVPCFTLRDNTERPVTIRAGTNTLLGLDPARIREIPALLEVRSGSARGDGGPELWDGHAADRVAQVVADW